VFSTGQSVRPKGGRRWTALSGPVRSFSKLALRPGAKDYKPHRPPPSTVKHVSCQGTCRISKKSRLGTRLLMSSQLSSVPRGGNILIILIAGIRVLVYDRKKEAGEHTTSTTPPGFSIRSCILRTIFRTDATLSHLTPSLINLRWFLVMQAPRVYPTFFPSLDQGLMMREVRNVAIRGW